MVKLIMMIPPPEPLIFIIIIFIIIGYLVSALCKTCPVLTTIIMIILLVIIPYLIYLRNNYKFVKINYYEVNGQLYAQKEYSEQSHLYEVWTNCNYTMEEFRQHVEYEARHPLIKYFRREFLFYKELPKYQNNVYKFKQPVISAN